jgi:hypothetical protein
MDMRPTAAISVLFVFTAVCVASPVASDAYIQKMRVCLIIILASISRLLIVNSVQDLDLRSGAVANGCTDLPSVPTPRSLIPKGISVDSCFVNIKDY